MPTLLTQGAASARAYGFGASSAAVNYIEDVFSTYLYTGNSTTGGTQTITNNVDLSTKGGMVWIKGRNAASNNVLFDTARGAGTTASNNQAISSNLGTGEDLGASYDFLSAFNTNGFTVTQGGTTAATRGTNYNNVTYTSWTFRKQPKFFDIVTYTGTGANRTIAHNLGAVPGCIIVKRTDTTADWAVYHRSLANTQYMVLNSTAAAATGATRWNSTTPTSSVFSLGTSTDVNASGGTYFAYIFAHDAGGFGLTGTDNVISCGSFTTDGSGNFSVNLGYEPQWVLIKSTDFVDSWYLIDVMRDMSQTGTNKLNANTTGTESVYGEGFCTPTATGFTATTPGLFTGSQNFIYIAIRRGPMKTPTTGTSVFRPIARTGTGANTTITSNFVTDSVMSVVRTSGQSAWWDRLQGQLLWLSPNSTGTNITDSSALTSFANMIGVNLGVDAAYGRINAASTTYANWMFRRAPGFFDVVCYTGTGAASIVLNHNLTVIPEIYIIKARSAVGDWQTLFNVSGTQYRFWSGASPASGLNLTTASTNTSNLGGLTSTTFTPTFYMGNTHTNSAGVNYVAYLFASVAGVSKVGSYTGTGTTKQIDCGFTGGARFVLIKRTDSTGDWYVWDSARGIVAGNDPYLLLNSNAAEVTSTDYVDTYSAGFEISSTAPAAINANGGTFIFLAIA